MKLMIHHFMREALRVHKSTEAIFMSYIESKKSLLVSEVLGFSKEAFDDVGLDLMREEPGFTVEMLKKPARIGALRDFVSRGILRNHAWYYTLTHKDKILGVFVLPVDLNTAQLGDGGDTSIDTDESLYLKMCLRLISSELEISELKEQLKKNLIYNSDTGVLLEEVFKIKLKDEVTRSRRILKPTSLIYISIDGYHDLTLKQPQSVINKTLRAVATILAENCRVNDILGSAMKSHFLIGLPHTDKFGAGVKAERLRRIFESADFSPLFGAREKLTLSLGISEYPGVCSDADGLLKSSEESMYEAKKRGGNQFNIAVPSHGFVSDFVVLNEKFL